MNMVFRRQGEIAHDPAVTASFPEADLTVGPIDDLFDYDLPDFLTGHRPVPASMEEAR